MGYFFKIVFIVVFFGIVKGTYKHMYVGKDQEITHSDVRLSSRHTGGGIK